MNKKNRNKWLMGMIIYLLNIVFTLLFIHWSISNWNNYNVINDFNNKLFPWICCFATIQFITFYSRKVKIYDFGMWFVLLSYPFMYGILISDVLSLNSSLLWKPVLEYPSNILFHTYIFVALAIEAFILGYFLCYRDFDHPLRKDLPDQKEDVKVFQIGIVFLLIGGIARLVNDFRIITHLNVTNSYSSYSTAVSSGLLDDLAFLFLPGIFFIFFSGCVSKKTKNISFILILGYLSLIMMLTGSRKIQLFSILTLLLAYIVSENQHRFSIKKVIFFAFFGILTLNILIVIREYRFALSEVVPVFVERLLNFDLFNNILGEALGETGLTVLSIASIIEFVPTVFPYQIGATFIRTLPSFLPIGWLVGDYFNLASSTFVVNAFTKVPVGSSILGDFYWNWGFFGGCVASFIFGMLIAKIFTYKKNNGIRKNYALYFSLFSSLIILVRSELIDVFRSLVWLYIIVFVLQKINILKWRSNDD